jgi:hypothetical protein
MSALDDLKAKWDKQRHAKQVMKSFEAITPYMDRAMSNPDGLRGLLLVSGLGALAARSELDDLEYLQILRMAAAMTGIPIEVLRQYSEGSQLYNEAKSYCPDFSTALHEVALAGDGGRKQS